MAYAGRLAIIAGGLGGLGSATGKRLRSQGADLVLLYAPFEASRKDTVLESTFGSSNPDGVSAVECDITSEASVAAAFETISSISKSAGAFPSICINAAGYVSVTPLADTTAEEALKNIIPNLLGPFTVSKAFYHLYTTWKDSLTGGASAPPGRIVSIASQAAHVALDGHGPYCASKAGLIGLTKCMANEWGSAGITANTVSPGVALTELGKKAWSEGPVRDKHLADIPTGRFSEPEEIAGVIELLCGDGMGNVNGADLRVDGGFTIR
ncbi:short chain dehydrogenase [Rhizodiscina lignyota]|uniref:Short chain dehydrogenase n=1 Tax=Rhizodiscina lignyota TaxID=1504668 RepID=A0A9P4I469_9PEZI|nr:short chain dehydrogenase [Rhizodiscina lignyota]